MDDSACNTNNSTEWQASKLMVQTLRPNQIADNINADCRHTNKQIQVEVSVAVGGLGFGCAWLADCDIAIATAWQMCTR